MAGVAAIVIKKMKKPNKPQMIQGKPAPANPLVTPYPAPQQSSHNYGQAAAYGAAGAAAGMAAGAYMGSHSGSGGAPPPGGPPYEQVRALLMKCVHDQKLQGFVQPQGPMNVDQIARQIIDTGAVQIISQTWKLPPQVAIDLCQIALFNVVILVDDSSSMHAENGERINDVSAIVAKVAGACSLFDDDGIEIRFLNSNEQGNHLESEQAAQEYIRRARFQGVTPLGTALDQKILQPMLVRPAMARQLRKPLLVVVVTDGAPQGEPANALEMAITNARNALMQTPYGPDAVSYQFAQVGEYRIPKLKHSGSHKLTQQATTHRHSSSSPRSTSTPSSVVLSTRQWRTTTSAPR